MKKTLNLFRNYEKLLREQGEDPAMAEQDPSIQPQDNPEPPPTDEVMPLTSEAEDKYIADLIDAALFEPSPEEANTLVNLQSVMQMKRYKNAREEVLPMVLGIINSSSSNGDLKKQLNRVEV